MTKTKTGGFGAAKGRVVRAAALSTAAALATNLVVFAIARAADVALEFPKPGDAAETQTVAAASVVTATLLAMILGWGLVGLAVWKHRPPLGAMAIAGAVFTIVATIALVGLDADASTKLTLSGLHLVVGALYIAGITWLNRE